MTDRHRRAKGTFHCDVCGKRWPCLAYRDQLARQPIIEGSHLPPEVGLGVARDQAALRGDLEAIGRDFRKAIDQVAGPMRRTIEQLLPYRCPLCGQRLVTLIGLKAHLSMDHSWWERSKHWAKRWRKP